MEDNLKTRDQDNAGQTPAQKQADEIHRNNPGLKDEKVQRKGNNNKNNDVWNEDPMEEKKAIEDTSEGRLSEAE